MQLILASSSRYRKRLLERLRLPFATDSPEVDETPEQEESAARLVRRLARAKAEAVAARNPGSLVIGSDQVASLDEVILGKPGTPARALEQLRHCQGREVLFETGLCLYGPEGNCQQASVTTRVEFEALNDDLLRRYIELEQPLDCAGSFKCEGLGVVLFRRIVSEDPTALEGLPLIALTAMLRQAGMEPLAM